MIFKKIIFKNYKTYYGTQEIDLYIPPEQADKEKKNIILVGGLNGAGKTTFLKAILYVLFGKRGITNSTSPSEIEAEYVKLFSNVINNTFFEEGGNECSVTLILETDQGAEWTLSVKWYVNAYKKIGHEVRELTIKETKTSYPKKVKVDNIDSYNRFIDKIIPFYAAPFFIFDGEEIRTLIEKQSTREMKNAIQKLSGMNANEQLISDLNTLKSNLLKEISKSSNSTKVGQLQEKYDEVSLKLNELKNKSDEAAEKIKVLSQERNELQKIRQEKLLSNSKSRETISKKLGQIEAQLLAKQQELHVYFKENMIGIILSSKIQSLKNRLTEEKKFREQKTLQSTLLRPYEDFMEKLLELQLSPPLTAEQIQQLKEVGKSVWLEKNKQAKVAVPEMEELHDLTNSDLNYLLNIQIKNVQFIINIINEIDRLNSEQEEIMLQLQNAPESSDTKAEEAAIEAKTKQITQIQVFQASRTKKINQLSEEKRALETQLTKNKVTGGNVDQLYAEMQYLDRTIKALVKYDEEYTNYKANMIKEEFQNMLVKLFRKKDEFGKIEFDTNTFSIRLYNDKMQEISIQDRSAGEMQMISSSLIWALTRASKLKLPVVIDTPLGRLDSYHRTHLINHYYRHLSNQVIILSTDTEITQDYIDLMTEASHKQYMLDYDEKKKYTVIRDGYFNFVKGGK